MPVWEMPWALLKPSARVGQESPPVGTGEEYYEEHPLARASEPPGPAGEGAAEYYECHPRAGAREEYPPAGAGEDEDPLAAGGGEYPLARAGEEAPPRTTEELLAAIAWRVAPGVRLLARRLDAARRDAGGRSLLPPTGPQPSCGPRPPVLRRPPQGPPRAGPTVRPRGSVGRMVLEKARPPPPPVLEKARPPPPPPWRPAAAAPVRPALPAYLRSWDLGVRPKAVCQLSGRPSRSARVADGPAEGDRIRAVRPRFTSPSGSPMFGALTGSQRRRAEREADARRIGLEGLLDIFVESGLAAAERAARERGFLQ